MFHNKKKETFISENCNICGEELTQVEDILVDIENDTYLCLDCKEYHKINAIKCIDFE